MPLGGFLGRVINRTAEVVLPKGTRGAFLGNLTGIQGGAALGSAVSTALSGAEEALMPALQGTTESALSTSQTGVSNALVQPFPLVRGTTLPSTNRSLNQRLTGQAGMENMDNVLDIRYDDTRFPNNGVSIGGMCDSAPAMKKIVTVRRTCDGVCVDVTRKQQAMLKRMLRDNCADPQFAVATILNAIFQQTGISITGPELMCLVNRRFKARPISISQAQIRSARRLINDQEKINHIAAEIGKLAKPKRTMTRRKKACP